MSRRIHNSKKKRRKLFAQQEGRCHYCGKQTVLPGVLMDSSSSGYDHLHGAKNGARFEFLWHNHPGFQEAWQDVATIEHLVPLSMGGNDHNTVLACYACNHSRGREHYFANHWANDNPNKLSSIVGYRWSEMLQTWVPAIGEDHSTCGRSSMEESLTTNQEPVGSTPTVRTNDNLCIPGDLREG